MFALKEKEDGEWESTELCMGDDTVCTDGLVGEDRERHILSFGEDEDGELYVLVTSTASTTSRSGVVYRITDPSRSVIIIMFSLWYAYNYIFQILVNINRAHVTLVCTVL